MAAGTETAVDTRGNVNLVGNIVQKVLLARQLAEEERKFASKKAEEAGTSLEEAGIERGYFFKKALIGQFGGNYVDKKKAELKNVVKKYKIAKRITKNPKTAFKFVKQLLKKDATKAQTKMFRAKFDYSYSDDVERPEPLTPVVPSRTKKIQKAGTGKRISRDQLLTTLSDLVDSLNKTAESIGKNTSGLSSGIISSTHSQQQVVEQLKQRNDTIENKLDKIAEAISKQTQFQKASFAKKEQSKKEQNLEQIKDTAKQEVPDNTQTKENETLTAELQQSVVPTTSITNVQNIIPATSAQRTEMAQMDAYNDIPQLETGGIVSGPNSGYVANVPKNTAVIPIKNNYTEGKPSAVDGKVRPIPAEAGMKSSSVGGKFGFGITNMSGIAKGGTTEGSALSQPLIDAMSLPMMAAGGAILTATTKYMQQLGGENANLAPEIERIVRPIANTFGLPPAIVNKAKQTGGAKGTDGDKDGKDKESKHDIFAKLTEGFGNLLTKLTDSINTRSAVEEPIEGTTASGSQDLLTLATVAALESGSAQGRADVAQSVYNRLADKKYGSSITDILTREGQYQVAFKDPTATTGPGTQVADVFKNIKTEDDAVRAIMYYFRARGQSITPEQARKHVRDSLAAIKDARLRQNAARHVGGRTEFRGYDTGRSEQVHRGGRSDNYYVSQYGSGNQMRRGAVAPPTGLLDTPTASAPSSNISVQLGQTITNNYGLKVGQERTFNHPQYGEIKAHKTAVGFDFYRGGEKLDMSPSKPQAKSIVEYFKSINGGVGTSIGASRSGYGNDVSAQISNRMNANLISSSSPITPPADSTRSEQVERLASEIDSSNEPNIFALIPGEEPTSIASTDLPSTVETTTTGRGQNPILNTGIYHEFYG
jgi:spore germination cell wall hydrolase CwlJ-like protein